MRLSQQSPGLLWRFRPSGFGVPSDFGFRISGLPTVAAKSSFVDKVLGRIGRLDTQGLQSVVQRLARERAFLETLFNTIEDGVLVIDEQGRILYFNQAITRFLGLQADVEGQSITEVIPEL